jgi:glycine betaine/proline transport system ATP-binding protein
VLGQEGRFEGTVSIDSMLQALAAGHATLSSAFLNDVAPVPESLPLNALVGRIIRNPFPLAVVDGTQRYLGAVTQTVLLKRMVIEESEHV